MDCPPSEFETTQVYSSTQPIPELRDDWNPFSDVYDYAGNTSQSLAFPNFYPFPDDPYRPNSFSGQGQMAQLRDQTHPSSHGRPFYPASIKMPSRSTNPIQQRKEKVTQAKTSRTGQTSAKRLKIASPAGRGHQRCYSEVSQVSECCSSCPDTPPCDVSDCCSEPECDLQPVAVVPCYEQSCEKPVCSNPCLSSGIQVSMPALPIETRTSNWLDSQWLPQTASLGPLQHSMGGGFESHYTSTSASPAPTTPSMSHHMDTPYSPNAAQSTPQYATFPSQMFYNDTGPLTSTTATFPNTNWGNIGAGASNSVMTSCLWNGCQEQQFDNEQQWLSHLHNSHIDPQMNFGCPLQGDSCPPSMSINPLDHLQTDHGFNFEFTGNGFECPAPNCDPNQTFFSPSMFHNHFDQIHAVPAQGSLQCGWGTCNTPFVDPQDLIAHLSQQHNLPISLPADHSHHHEPSFSAETTGIRGSLAQSSTKKRSASPTPATTTTPELDVNGDFTIKESVHQCKWNDGDAPCGEICESEESLQKHIKHSHLESLDKSTGYKCRWDGCSRDSRRGEAAGFTQRGKLERHMATHTGFKCCSCTECGKTFSAEQSLRQHMLLHRGEKPWKCKHCGKGFPQQSACTIHERTHTKEKPLQCPTCGKCFSESSNLSKHRKIHGEKGLNMCDFPGCGKSFHRFDQLKRHRMTHEKQLAKLRELGEGKSSEDDAES